MIKHIARFLSDSTQGGIINGVDPLSEHLSLFFVQATIIMGICRFLSLLGYYLGQPRVIFEIIGGVLLGPSAIGRNQEYLDKIFPSSSLSYISLVANIGLTLYLFLVGLELDPKLLKTHAQKAGGIAIVGMAVPFALGVAISQIMFDVLQGDDPDFKDVKITSFFVFIGTAMSITAFPVLARILKEGGLIYTKAGAMAMGAAALNDAIAWCLLTLAISIANAGSMSTAGYIFLTVVGLALVLFFVVRPIFERLVIYVENMHNPAMNSNLFALTLCILFMCAWTTALLGVHSIFGAFLFGLIVPRGSHLFKECNERIEEIVVTFTLPLYFALSGLQTDVTTIRSAEEGAITVLVCVCATAGKFIGAGGTAYFSGLSLRESSVVAVLMNTRGLIELIVLNLGMSSGILNVRTFSVMVIMCLFTTFITSPLIELIYPKSMRIRVVEEGEEEETKKELEMKAMEATNAEQSDEIVVPHAQKYNRLSLVVDSLHDMQYLINLLVHFIPQALHSELSVTMMHFIEPTHTTKDEFLALNHDGRLIRVDEQTTNIATALHDMEDPAAKKPDLLPLSMFCKAMNIAVNAFRIQGDPDEFPVELKQISKLNDCRSVIMPWRPHSFYLQKFFWSSLHLLSIPVVLLMIKEPSTGSEAGGDEERDRSNSLTNSPQRIRAGSFARFNSYLRADIEDGGIMDSHKSHHDHHDHHDHHEQLFTNLPADVVPTNKRGSIKTSITKLQPMTRLMSQIIVLITGELSDLLVFPMALRFAENKMNEINVLIPQDSNAFSETIVEALKTFKKEALNYPNVKIIDLVSISTDFKGLYEDCIETPFDVLICSFVPPPSATPPTLEVESITPTFRSHTLGGVLADTILPRNNDMNESRLLTGMPPKYAFSQLTYPELGMIGSLIQEGNFSKSCMTMIIHEGEKTPFNLHLVSISSTRTPTAVDEKLTSEE